MGVLTDERGDERLRKALEMVWGGQVGSWPGRFINEIFRPEVVGLEFAPIEVEIAEDLTGWRAWVPGLVRAEARVLVGPTSDGKPPRVENLPGAETGPGQSDGRPCELHRVPMGSRRQVEQAHHV